MVPVLNESSSLLDIGCAKGELIWLLKERWPDIHYAGLEYAESLIKIARQEPRLKNVEFHQGDAFDFDLQKEFDVVVLSGLLSIFDEIEPPLHAAMRHLRSGGWGLIFGGFTSMDIDVLVKFRNNHQGLPDWQAGWNMFSLNTVQKILNPHVDEWKAIPFQISIDLPKSESPEKSYTLNTAEKGRILVTGGNIVREMYLISFRKKIQ
jgi:ubiquinone/menaquinone biosynthesis C-methylase UbiE